MTHELTDAEMLERQNALGRISNLDDLKTAWESMQPARPRPDYRAYGSGSAGNGRLMESRYNGRCADCSGPIAAGDMIRYDGKAHHADAETCEEWRDAEAARLEGEELQAKYDEVEAEWLAMQGPMLLAPTEAPTIAVTAPSAPAEASAPATIADGVYTLVEESGDYVTIKVHSPKRGNWVGQTIVSYLFGSDNGADYTAFGTLDGARVRPWYAYRSNSRLIRLTEALADPAKAAAAGLAYALESGNCYKCGRRLTVPASIHAGMGPDCAAKA